MIPRNRHFKLYFSVTYGLWTDDTFEGNQGGGNGSLSQPRLGNRHKLLKLLVYISLSEAGFGCLTSRRRQGCSVRRLRLGALDHEPEHERHLPEEGGEGEVRDHILVLRQRNNLWTRNLPNVRPGHSRRSPDRCAGSCAGPLQCRCSRWGGIGHSRQRRFVLD